MALQPIQHTAITLAVLEAVYLLFKVLMLCQMQVPYLIEWIEFHRILGFTHFVIYDDFSSDNVSLLETLYREHGRQYITVHAPSGHGLTNNERRSQNAGHCSEHYSNASDWMINIDVDEFITMSPYKTVQEYLTAEVAEGTHMIYVGATRFGWAGQRDRLSMHCSR